MKQHGAAFEKASAEERKLDAIFVCTGGSSLLAGIAAAVKQVYPDTKVIGVEPHCNDLLSQATAAPPPLHACADRPPHV